jgi:hypothetical protein
MSCSDEDDSPGYIGLDNLLSSMSVEAVSKAMEGFELFVQNGKDMAWLAMAARRALAVNIRDLRDSKDRNSNALIRSDLMRMANMTDDTWRKLFEREPAVDRYLWDYAFQHWDEEGSKDTGDDMIIGEPHIYVRFTAAIQELDFLTSLLRDAAKEIETQRGPWRRSELKRLSIERAQYLAPIFEAAFAQSVSANNFPGGAGHVSPTPFMDFYQRMVALALNEQATPDLSGVVKEACHRHRKHPAAFPDDMIPGL